MKKWVYLTVCSLLCFVLAGCASTDKQNVTGNDGNAPQTEEWDYEVSCRVESGETRSDDKHLVASYRYEVPEISVHGSDGSSCDEDSEGARVEAAFNGYFEDWLVHQQDWFAEMSGEALEDYAVRGQEDNSPWSDESFFYTDEMTASFWRNDHIVCVTLAQYSFTGGAHGYAARDGVTFDMSSGKQVHISDMTSDFKKVDEVVEQEILRQIDAAIEKNGEGNFFEDYAETVKDWDERAIFFDDDAMTVSFAVYDIAPYAAGEQNFAISYDLFRPYLNDYGREVLELTA